MQKKKDLDFQVIKVFNWVPVAEWLSFGTLKVVGTGSIPGGELRFPHAKGCGQKKIKVLLKKGFYWII